TKDPLVPYDQAIMLAEAMTSAGVPGRVELIAGGGHGFAKPDMDRTMQETLDFFDKNLKTSR
ncbi:MAG TPA: prolyl oligopeptidase family serine peptidase, partial [Isosphaeraceae bacterium]|nr:prolyl oligopeptidase family serine peptidase [Isosphaeraceae bacterium]